MGEESLADLPKWLRDRLPELNYFSYSHLPKSLKPASKPFYGVALGITKPLLELEESLQGDFELAIKETRVALRKLLESKDAAVRARLHYA